MQHLLDFSGDGPDSTTFSPLGAPGRRSAPPLLLLLCRGSGGTVVQPTHVFFRGSGGGSGHAATSRDVLDAACVCRPRPLRRPRSGRGSVFASYPLPLTSYPTGAWRWATSSRRRRSSGAALPRTRASSAASPEPMLRRLTALPGSVVPCAASDCLCLFTTDSRSGDSSD